MMHVIDLDGPMPHYLRPAPEQRAQARRMVRCLIRNLRSPAWQKGHDAAAGDASMRAEVHAWRALHTGLIGQRR